MGTAMDTKLTRNQIMDLMDLSFTEVYGSEVGEKHWENYTLTPSEALELSNDLFTELCSALLADETSDPQNVSRWLTTVSMILSLTHHMISNLHSHIVDKIVSETKSAE
jgi:hypothetical protein